MKEVKFVNADELSTIEEYGAALLSSMISLKTLESFHISAFTKGILDDDETETSKTICWEIQRLMSLYKTQIQNVLDRTNLSEEEVMNSLKSMIPNGRLPKTVKKPNKKKDKDNVL